MEQLGFCPDNDTICAISTPAGMGGIAVIRVSGKDAINNVMKSWRGKDLHNAVSHTAHLGQILTPDKETLDEVVATVFRSPNSFTGEDVVELSCHGSLWIQRQLVNLLIDNGCRAATGGEFTRRAFTNGRIDLSQAEAIADVIAASSAASHRIAISQMRGGFSQKLSELRNRLLEFASLLELELDFSEEEVEFADRKHLLELATKINGVINALAGSFAVGNAIKNGFPVAIVGETNAGKSTLLNTLLHDDKALVSDISGTTRDVIEDTILLNGLMFRFIDTAGIRNTTDKVETMGIERTYKKIGEASIVLWMIDGVHYDAKATMEMASRIAPLCQGKALIATINKLDEIDKTKLSDISDNIRKHMANIPIITISAKRGTGINELENLLVSTANIADSSQNDIIVTNARHYEALTHAGKSIRRAIDGLQANLSGDFIAQDIRECMHYLGEITGEITTNEILGSIFSRFCVGK